MQSDAGSVTSSPGFENDSTGWLCQLQQPDTHSGNFWQLGPDLETEVVQWPSNPCCVASTSLPLPSGAGIFDANAQDYFLARVLEKNQPQWLPYVNEHGDAEGVRTDNKPNGSTIVSADIAASTHLGLATDKTATAHRTTTDGRDENNSEAGACPKTALQRTRNRAAATKYRARSRVQESKLRSQAALLEQKRTRLMKEVAGLWDELLCLKSRALDHARCNDHKIDEYLTTIG